MNTKVKSKKRVPHGFMKRLIEMTGYTQPTISNAIRSGNTKHKAWVAYEQLLKEALAKKEQELTRVANVEKLREQLAA